MSLVVLIKVHEGVAVAADSQRTRREWPSGMMVGTSYDAYKIFQLAKGFPVGLSFYGSYMIGEKSIPQLMQELERRFQRDAGDKWKLNKDAFQIDCVATRVKQFIFDERYKEAFQPNISPIPAMGFQLFGYSSNDDNPEIYSVSIQEKTGLCDGPILLMDKEETGISYGGEEGEGGSKGALEALILRGDFPSDIPPGMTLDKAAALAESMVAGTISHMRENFNEPTVGGPVDVGKISKSRGFEWVRYKGYAP